MVSDFQETKWVLGIGFCYVLIVINTVAVGTSLFPDRENVSIFDLLKIVWKIPMITIIAGTNRHGSMTLKTANIYYKMLQEAGADVHMLSLEGKQVWERGADMMEIERTLLIPSTKFLFVMPEYNASFPGILKMLMDNSDVKKCWWYKKAALVGLSDGRAGNLRGLEHMTAILNYLKINVLYNKMLLSKIGEEVDTNGHLLKSGTEKLMQVQVEEFLKF